MPATMELPKVLPIIPTRNNRVLLPGIVLRLQIGRRDTTTLMDQLWAQYSRNQNIIVGCVPVMPPSAAGTAGNGDSKSDLVTVTTPTDDARRPVDPDELFGWGATARVINFVKNNASEARLTKAAYVVTLEGIARFKVDMLTRTAPFFEAAVTHYIEAEPDKEDPTLQAQILSLRTTGHELANVLSQLQLPPAVLNQLRQMLDSTPPSQLADLFASMIDLSLEEKLNVLSTPQLSQRIIRVLELLVRQIQVLKISQKLQSTVESKLGKKQREFFLRQQLDAIKKELGESDEGTGEEDEVADLGRRLGEAKLPDEPAKVAGRELRRLKRMHPSIAEHQVIRTYLETLLELPWATSTPDMLDIGAARKKLDADHCGLEKVKTRILEYLAVRKLKNDMKGPILCFLGPPGVGKTSLGRSIASALGRKFHRISLGGVRDEAEIRGHRRTYIGAMPGLIVGALKKCGNNNPVILLDEIDKLGRDFRGDPASALLEVLDPEQNSTFTDHYLNVPFDLSNVLFIATANEADTIPGPLFDRMEVIRIPGYTFDEKLSIARRHLLPKQIILHGLSLDQVQIDDVTLLRIATGYTREAGVRNLEREIASVCRAVAVDYADAKENNKGESFDSLVTVKRVETILGPERFDDEVSERTATPGVVTGLAWTASGAGGLLFIEASLMPGRGVLHLTGSLGEVIKESAQIGLTWVRANSARLNLKGSKSGAVGGDVFEGVDVHIHFPAGSTPKDGPSAGVTIVTSLVSLFTSIPVRDHTAMTGELTLRGQVLPVGGIKEKVLAAHRGGITRVILPLRNQKDLAEVPKRVIDDIEFVFVRNVWDVLDAAFVGGITDAEVPKTGEVVGAPVYEQTGAKFFEGVVVLAKL